MTAPIEDKQYCSIPQDCHHADIAADRAVKKVFAILGVDVDRPESVAEFQEDLRFGRKMRRAADHGQLAFIGALTVAMAAALWAGVVKSVSSAN